MNVTVIESRTLEATMKQIGDAARSAASCLATAETATKNTALEAMAKAIMADIDVIMAANTDDLAEAASRNATAAFIDRLKLTPDRIAATAQGLRDIAALDDPVGAVIAAWKRPNGLQIERVRSPLGVIGIIYESRPNVTADAGALCLKAGNAAVLRGGSAGWRSSRAIHACLVQGLRAAELPESAIQIVPTRDRDAVGLMLAGMEGGVDVIVPRGGRSLVERVQEEARVPVFAHLEGICHLYVHASADVDMAIALAVNSKLRRTGICGAVECLLVDRKWEGACLNALVAALVDAGCEVRGDEAVQDADNRVIPSAPQDWGREFLDAIAVVKTVDGIDDACNHIETYGSKHTDGIIAGEKSAAEAFFSRLDSAILLHNASTQFADGGEFGMGAEIGIATGKFHARGPVGVEQLTSYQYHVRGDGQTRP